MARRHGEAWRGVTWRGVVRRGVEGVKGVKGGLARAWPVGLDGLTLLKGVDLPWTLDPSVRGASQALFQTFWLSWCAYFFHCFFDAFLDRSWLHFASQLGPQNQQKSDKNGLQEASYLRFRFWIDFWSIFAPNWQPRKPTTR